MACTRAIHLGHFLDGAHDRRAQAQQVADPGQVAGGDVGEVVARGERLPLGGEHDAGGQRASAVSNASAARADIASESALRRSGRFIVIRTMSPSCLTSRCS
jgi:hypothetical protein